MKGQTVHAALSLVVWFLGGSALADPLPSVKNNHEFSLFQDDQRFAQSVGGGGARVPGRWESFCSSEFSVIFCNIVGEFFDNTGKKVDFVADVQCDDADPSNSDDPRASTDCGCVLTSATDATGVKRDDCSCQVCPNGVGFAPIVVSCQEPIVGSCSSVDCNRECDGSCFPPRCPIENSAPQISLISPRQGQQFVLTDLILLSATAVDLEDDAEGNVVQVVWTINGFLQRFGNNLTIRADTLGEGPHLISAYAIDSASRRSNTASVTITIFNTLPPTRAPSPGLPTFSPSTFPTVLANPRTSRPTSRAERRPKVGLLLPRGTTTQAGSSASEGGFRFRYDETIQFQANATDGEDNPLPMNWTLNTFEQGRLDDLGRGEVKASDIGVAVHRIQIYAIDSLGQRGEIEFTVLVEARQCQEEITSSSDQFLIDFFEPLEPKDEQTFTETFIETYRSMNRDNCNLQKFDAFSFVANARGRRLTQAKAKIASSCKCPKCQGTLWCYFGVGRRLEKTMVSGNETLSIAPFDHRHLQEDLFFDQCICRRTNKETTFEPPTKEEFIIRLNLELVKAGITEIGGFDIATPPNLFPSNQPTNQPTRSPTKAPTKKPTELPSPSATMLPTAPPTQDTDRSVPDESPPPTQSPTNIPTNKPTKPPSASPTTLPTDPPTEKPTLKPTRVPTYSPLTGFQCRNSRGWRANGYRLGCGWVSRNPEKRCFRRDRRTGRRAFEACPLACGDSSRWSASIVPRDGGTRRRVGCPWVGRQPRKRCNVRGGPYRNIPAFARCAIACCRYNKFRRAGRPPPPLRQEGDGQDEEIDLDVEDYEDYLDFDGEGEGFTWEDYYEDLEDADYDREDVNSGEDAEDGRESLNIFGLVH